MASLSDTKCLARLLLHALSLLGRGHDDPCVLTCDPDWQPLDPLPHPHNRPPDGLSVRAHAAERDDAQDAAGQADDARLLQLLSKIITQCKIRNDISRTGDDLVKHAFESIYRYVEEEMQAVQERFSHFGLSFSVTRSRAMTRWRFFLCVVILHCISWPSTGWAAKPPRQDARGRHEPQGGCRRSYH